MALSIVHGASSRSLPHNTTAWRHRAPWRHPRHTFASTPRWSRTHPPRQARRDHRAFSRLDSDALVGAALPTPPAPPASSTPATAPTPTAITPPAPTPHPGAIKGRAIIESWCVVGAKAPWRIPVAIDRRGVAVPIASETPSGGSIGTRNDGQQRPSKQQADKNAFAHAKTPFARFRLASECHLGVVRKLGQNPESSAAFSGPQTVRAKTIGSTGEGAHSV